MSVRRLAADQPDSFAFTADNLAWAKAQIASYPEGREASAVIALLWRAQYQAGGWLPRKAIEHVADVLGMPNIRVLEVATFYTMFNLEPVGRYHVQLCGTTPCMLRGSEDIKAVCRERIGEQNHVTEDGNFSWVEVECLGACVNAPMVQINDDYYEDLTPESFGKILDALAAGRTPRTGPQDDRQFSAPVGGPTTLTDPALFERGNGKTPSAPPKPAPPVAKPAVAPAAPPTVKPAAAEAGPEQDPLADHPQGSEAQAEADEKEVAAKLAALPKDASAELKADTVGKRPPALDGPRGGKGDDLKKISGIGKVNEGRLHKLGIYHFGQIAAWGRPEILWVATYLTFPGRIDRENWVGQAKTLAAGGETDFSKRAGGAGPQDGGSKGGA